jgi:hypothetical protein
MWIFTFLPEWAIHAVFSLGVLGLITGFVLGFIPFIKQYKLPIQIISILIFALGLYLEGGLADNKEWQLKVKELEAKLAKAEAEGAKKNIEIETKIVEKVRIVKEKGDKQVEYITKVEKGDTLTIEKDMSEEERKKFQMQVAELRKSIESCTIPQLIIDEHNKAIFRPSQEVKK